MNKKRKTTALLLIATLSSSLIVGCSNKEKNKSEVSDPTTINQEEDNNDNKSDTKKPEEETKGTIVPQEPINNEEYPPSNTDENIEDPKSINTTVEVVDKKIEPKNTFSITSLMRSLNLVTDNTEKITAVYYKGVYYIPLNKLTSEIKEMKFDGKKTITIDKKIPVNFENVKLNYDNQKLDLKSIVYDKDVYIKASDLDSNLDFMKFNNNIVNKNIEINLPKENISVKEDLQLVVDDVVSNLPSVLYNNELYIKAKELDAKVNYLTLNEDKINISTPKEVITVDGYKVKSDDNQINIGSLLYKDSLYIKASDLTAGSQYIKIDNENKNVEINIPKEVDILSSLNFIVDGVPSNLNNISYKEHVYVRLSDLLANFDKISQNGSNIVIDTKKLDVTQKNLELTLNWLRDSDMITDDLANHKRLKDGGFDYTLYPDAKNIVLWNYNMNTKKFDNGYVSQGSILSVNTTMRALIDAYEKTGDGIYKVRAINLAEYIKNNTVSGKIYGADYKFIVSMRRSLENFEPTYGEVYTQDIAMSATSLFRLYEITGDEQYKILALDFMNTLNRTQDLVYAGTIAGGGENPNYLKGGFFWMYSHLGGNAFGPSWATYGMDNVDMIVDAYSKAYEVTSDIDYNNRLDDYKTFVLDIINNRGGLSPSGYPYEYFANRDGSGYKGQNWDQVESTWGENENFTTDQFFYFSIGIAKLDSTLGANFLNKANNMHTNGLFSGQYSVDGKGYDGEDEIINTGMYLELIKQVNDLDNKVIAEKALIDNMTIDTEDTNAKYGYDWAVKGETGIIESIATSRITSAILK